MKAAVHVLTTLCAMVAVAVALLWSPSAAAHPRSVGVVQAETEADGVKVLVKLDAETLFTALALGPPEDFSPDALEAGLGRQRAMHYIADTIVVQSWQGLCDRDTIPLYALSPSKRFLDIIMVYRCARPVGFVRLTTTPLLDDPAHYLEATFKQGVEVTTRKLRPQKAEHFFTFDDTGGLDPFTEPPPGASAPAQEEPPGDRAWWMLALSAAAIISGACAAWMALKTSGVWRALGILWLAASAFGAVTGIGALLHISSG